MSEEEFRAVWDMLLASARIASLIPIEKVKYLIEVANQSEAIAPIIEPTKWINGGGKNISDQKRVAEAFLAFRLVIESVRGTIENVDGKR